MNGRLKQENGRLIGTKPGIVGSFKDVPDIADLTEEIEEIKVSIENLKTDLNNNYPTRDDMDNAIKAYIALSITKVLNEDV